MLPVIGVRATPRMSAENMDDADVFEREADNRRRLVQAAEDLDRRERDQEERRQRESFQTGPPHHSTAGSIPIHQPVASRLPGTIHTIHSPGGLLANHGSSGPPMPLGAPSGPATNFGGPLQPNSNRPPQHAEPNNPSQHQMFAPIPHATNPPSTTAVPPGGPPPGFGALLQQREPHQALQQGHFPGGAGPGGNGSGGGAGNGGGPQGGQPPNQMHNNQGQGPGGLAQGQQPILNVSLMLLYVPGHHDCHGQDAHRSAVECQLGVTADGSACDGIALSRNNSSRPWQPSASMGLDVCCRQPMQNTTSHRSVQQLTNSIAGCSYVS